MERWYGRRAFHYILCIVLVLSFFMPPLLLGQEKKKEDENKPERLIEMAVEYPIVEVSVGEEVNLDLIFHNKGKSNENVDVWVDSSPKGWKARIKTYQYTVMGAHVPSGEDKRLTFDAVPDKDIKPGDYEFAVKAKTLDGQFKMAQTILIKVKEKEKGAQEAKGVRVATSYPILRGPSDAKFEFSVEVESKLDKDAVFDLFAQGPEGWEMNFKPAYETKYISSINLKPNQTQSVAVEVKPAVLAKTGEYPITLRVSSGNARAETKVNVMITGNYNLEVGTLTGLLSLEAKQGSPANVSIYVKNTGTAANHDVKFLSFKPENWKVEFKPEKIDVIEPGELKQVEVTITPYKEALVGDYSVGAQIQGEKVDKTIEFRATVKTSTAWGWIGIGIIIVVIVGLTGLFRWLGRR